MNWQMKALTITTFLGTSHPTYFCRLFESTNHGVQGMYILNIDDANKLMWELKKKGWETKTTTTYNPYSPHVYTREIHWLHLDSGMRDD